MNQEYGSNSEPVLIPGVRRGYRGWRLQNGILQAVSHDQLWNTETLYAICGNGLDHPNPSPDLNCTCGIYAKYFPYEQLDGMIWGAIDATGRVSEGSKGFRAQNAKIVALYVVRHRNENNISYLSKLIEDRYDVPIFGSWNALFRQFPPDEDVDFYPEDSEYNFNTMLTIMGNGGGNGGNGGSGGGGSVTWATGPTSKSYSVTGSGYPSTYVAHTTPNISSVYNYYAAMNITLKPESYIKQDMGA